MDNVAVRTARCRGTAGVAMASFGWLCAWDLGRHEIVLDPSDVTLAGMAHTSLASLSTFGVCMYGTP